MNLKDESTNHYYWYNNYSYSSEMHSTFPLLKLPGARQLDFISYDGRNNRSTTVASDVIMSHHIRYTSLNGRPHCHTPRRLQCC